METIISENPMHQDYIDRHLPEPCVAHRDTIDTIRELQKQQGKIEIKLDRNTVQISDMNKIMVALLENIKESNEISRQLIDDSNRKNFDIMKAFVSVISLLLGLITILVLGPGAVGIFF